MDKAALRVQLKSERAALSAPERERKSQAIIKSAMKLINWESVHSMHCYRPVNSEVDTTELIAEAQKRGVLVAVPDPGIHQPTAADAQKSYDLIIVPMLGFDASLHRLGYGGGYYDRFLATQTGLKVGLCYQIGLVETGLPAEPHDVALDVIVTEDRVYRV